MKSLTLTINWIVMACFVIFGKTGQSECVSYTKIQNKTEVQKATLTYDEEGNLLEEIGFFSATPQDKYISTYNKIGKISKKITYSNGEEFGLQTFTYNSAAQLIKRVSNRITTGEITAIDYYNFDSLGNILSELYYVRDNSINDTILVKSILYSYENELNLKKETKTWDWRKKVFITTSVINKYDVAGNNIETREYGKDKNLISIVEKKYGKEGLLIESKFYNPPFASGKPLSKPNVEEYLYNKDGKLIKKIVKYGLEIFQRSKKFDTYTFEYSDDGKLVRESSINFTGRDLVKSRTDKIIKYNKKGQLVSNIEYLDGKEFNSTIIKYGKCD